MQRIRPRDTPTHKEPHQKLSERPLENKAKRSWEREQVANTLNRVKAMGHR